jgi:hypothetical protein
MMAAETIGLKDLMESSVEYQRGFWAGVHKVEGLLGGIAPAAAPDMLEALKGLRTIAKMYHKGEAPGHLDTCECPDCCGHCLAMRKVDAAIAKAEGV